MVLELVPPHGATLEDLAAALADLPRLRPELRQPRRSTGTTTTTCSRRRKTVSGRVLWANMLLLFWLSLVPFGTAWIGETQFAPIPMALYGVVLLMCAFSYGFLVSALRAAPGPDRHARGRRWAATARAGSRRSFYARGHPDRVRRAARLVRAVRGRGGDVDRSRTRGSSAGSAGLTPPARRASVGSCVLLAVVVDRARARPRDRHRARRRPGVRGSRARGRAGRPTRRRTSRCGRTVEVDGRAVYLDCRGAGSPTVMLEAGFGAGAGWGPVSTTSPRSPGSAHGTGRGSGGARRAASHRPRDGRRPPRGARGGRGAGPFVVVAHSLGGVYGRLSRRCRGQRTVTRRAFVMIDTYEPDLGSPTTRA